MKAWFRRLSSLFFSIGLLVAVVLIWWQHWALYDWWRLRGYTPPANIVQLATDTTMTDPARHLFYVNHPVVEDKTSFNQDCQNNGGEQTIVLGCYHSHETGIFIYDVTDPQLSGVEQVTAAHEALHAIYERLSSNDRNKVNKLLQDFYQNGLADQRVKDTIEAYKKSEPNDLSDEMHSVFGTEVRNLPPELETHYARYFSNRQKIVDYSEQYESVFTNQKNQLESLKQQIDALEAQLKVQAADIDQKQTVLKAEAQRLNNLRQQGNTTGYNAAVPGYNAQVNSLNAEVNSYNQTVKRYRALIDQYNSLAVQTNKLNQALDSRADTVQTQ